MRFPGSGRSLALRAAMHFLWQQGKCRDRGSWECRPAWSIDPCENAGANQPAVGEFSVESGSRLTPTQTLVHVPFDLYHSVLMSFRWIGGVLVLLPRLPTPSFVENTTSQRASSMFTSACASPRAHSLVPSTLGMGMQR